MLHFTSPTYQGLPIVGKFEMKLIQLFFFFCRTLWPAGSQFPKKESNLCPLQWKRGVLTIGQPGKSRPNFLMVALNSWEAILQCFSNCS